MCKQHDTPICTLLVLDGPKHKCGWKINNSKEFSSTSYLSFCMLDVVTSDSFGYYEAICIDQVQGVIMKNGNILPTGQWYAPSAVINDALIIPE